MGYFEMEHGRWMEQFREAGLHDILKVGGRPQGHHREDAKKLVWNVAFVFALLTTSCTRAEPTSQTDIVQTSTMVTGWLAYRGEWIVFPLRDINQYRPFSNNEPRCVSLVTDESLARRLPAFEGSFVEINGRAVDYESLPTGENDVDRFLNKRYYGGSFVPNFCLQNFVFEVVNFSDADDL
ncbi:hypothetical protein GRI62_12350 [Erythrobacter arachoides]|uniref:Uncharacterized protein n=1 Tax=Aurantiacibacter arachoides TaxID=1850444 RepID=A0A845A631_9SPHN|nr:hypothetical protein [Aurantiacibacter arachoides]